MHHEVYGEEIGMSGDDLKVNDPKRYAAGGMMALLRRRLVRMGDERKGKDRGKPL